MKTATPTPRPEHLSSNPVAPYVVLTLASIFCAWWFWVGLMLARLWHYEGKLNGPFQKFDIQPEYIRERLARQKAEQELAGIPVPILDAHQWQANVRAYTDEELAKLPPETRKEILEDQRISRMPAFVADDCGDETLFPDVPPAIPAEEYNAIKFGDGEARKERSSDGYRELGLRKLGRREWLSNALDEGEFLEHHHARGVLLSKRHDECIQITPDGEDACIELMEEVVAFLIKEKPHWYQMASEYGERKICNKLSGEMWALQRPYTHHPLEICARLCMEDFNIVMRSPFSGKHTLVASATLAPSGWHLQRQIGRSASNILEPPLSWDKFAEIFDLFHANPDMPPLKRAHLFVQTNHNNRGLSDLFFITERHHFFPGNLSTLHNNLMIRKERQSFRMLPKSGAIVFTTQTKIRAVRDFGAAELQRAVQEIEEWPTHEATLKGRDLWGDILEFQCANMPASREDGHPYGEEASSETESWQR